MVLEVVEHSPVAGYKFTIILKSKNRADLDSSKAIEFAKEQAIKIGFQARGLSNTPTIYPVNAAGEVTDKLLSGEDPVDHWRADFKFSTGL